MNWRVCPSQNVAGLIKTAWTDIFLNGRSIFTSPGWVWDAGAAAVLVLSRGSPWAGGPRGAWTWCLCRGAGGYSHCPAPAVAPLLGLLGLGEMSSIGGLSRGDGSSCPITGGCRGLGEVSRGTGFYGFPTAPGPSDRCSPIDPFDRDQSQPQDPDPAGERWEEGARTPHPRCHRRGVVPAVPAAPLPCGACLGGYAVVFIAPSQPPRLRWQLFKVVIEKRGSCSAPRSRSNGSGSVPAASGQSPRGEPACDPACDPACVPACNKSGRNVPGCRARGGVPAAPGAGGAAVPDPEVLAASRPSPARLDPRDPQSAPGDTGSHHGA